MAHELDPNLGRQWRTHHDIGKIRDVVVAKFHQLCAKASQDLLQSIRETQRKASTGSHVVIQYFIHLQDAINLQVRPSVAQNVEAKGLSSNDRYGQCLSVDGTRGRCTGRGDHVGEDWGGGGSAGSLGKKKGWCGAGGVSLDPTRGRGRERSSAQQQPTAADRRVHRGALVDAHGCSRCRMVCRNVPATVKQVDERKHVCFGTMMLHSAENLQSQTSSPPCEKFQKVKSAPSHLLQRF